MNNCKITGDPVCKCKHKAGKIIVNYEDFKTSMRRVFTDHAVYTSDVIKESVPILQPDADENTNRLLENPADIRFLMEPFLGSVIGQQIQDLFTQHLKLAAATLEPARNGRANELQRAIDELLTQGIKIGQLLGSINPNKLNVNNAIIEFETHNQFVVQLVSLRSKDMYQEYIDTYDIYFNHMMQLSDTITNALVVEC